MDSPPGGHDEDASVIADSLTRPESFGELYHRHAAVIHRYAAHRLGEDAAEDITAETFPAPFRTRERYDVTRAGARPWLYGIATNLFGKQRRTEVRASEPWPARDTTPWPTPGRLLADSWTDRSDSRATAQAAQGRLAIGVDGDFRDHSWERNGMQVLLDPETFAHRDVRWVAGMDYNAGGKAPGGPFVPKGTVVGTSTPLATVVVDRAGGRD